MVHRFKDEFDKGKRGEAALDAHFATWCEITPATPEEDRRGIDRWLTNRETGQRRSVEYKTDHEAARTGNAFIETVSVDTSNKPGWAYTCEEAIAESCRRWRAANPEAVRAAWQRRYAREKAAEGNATTEDLAAIRAAQTDKQGRLICWHCGSPIEGTPHLDHWIPLLEDGTHNPGNLHYMHAKCNLSKGGKHPTEIGRLL